MKTIILFLALTALAFALGCSSVTYKHDFDKSANFAAMKAYAWVAAPADPSPSVRSALERNDLLDKRIKESVNTQMAAKGYTQNVDSPDFLVLYHIGTEDKINVTDYGYGYGPYGYGYGGYGGWYGGGGVDVQQYKEGTLILDIIDFQSKQLVWRGFATAALNPDASIEKREKRLNEVITNILSKFPPTAAK